MVQVNDNAVLAGSVKFLKKNKEEEGQAITDRKMPEPREATQNNSNATISSPNTSAPNYVSIEIEQKYEGTANDLAIYLCSQGVKEKEIKKFIEDLHPEIESKKEQDNEEEINSYTKEILQKPSNIPIQDRMELIKIALQTNSYNLESLSFLRGLREDADWNDSFLNNISIVNTNYTGIEP